MRISVVGVLGSSAPIGRAAKYRTVAEENGSIPASRPDTDDVGHALVARTMPPYLHHRADPDVPPRALRPIDEESGLVGDLVCPGPPPADSREATGGIIARGYGAAPSG